MRWSLHSQRVIKLIGLEVAPSAFSLVLPLVIAQLVARLRRVIAIARGISLRMG